MQNRHYSLDLAKYVASIMVVAIHTGLFSDVNHILNFAVVNVLCRLAVPFFAVCSGYFMGKCSKSGMTYDAYAFLRQWKKLIALYIAWTVIYMLYSIPAWVETGWFSLWAFVDFAIAACTKGSYYHLWYLWGMIYTLPVFYVIVKRVRAQYWVGLVAVLWFLKVAGYAYSFCLPSTLSCIIVITEILGDFFCLLPLLLIGAIIAQQSRKTRCFYRMGLMACISLLIAEALFLKHCGQEAVSYIIFTLPTAYFFFNCVLYLPARKLIKRSSEMAGISTFVYCAHPIFVEILSEYITASIMRFVVCSLISTCLGSIYVKFFSKQNRKKVFICSN